MSARRDLWAALSALSDELPARPLLTGDSFHCLKDMVLHIAAVEDGWLNEDILRRPPVIATVPALKDTPGGPAYAAVPLATLLDYWKAVEQARWLTWKGSPRMSCSAW